MHEVTVVDLEDFTQPTELFAQPDEPDPTDLADEKITPVENHQDNGATTTHSTQPSLPHSPLIDGSVASEPPPLPLRPRVDAVDAAHLLSTANHPEVCLKAADDALFSVYQDWVHQNTGTHLDDVINEDGKWQDR